MALMRTRPRDESDDRISYVAQIDVTSCWDFDNGSEAVLDQNLTFYGTAGSVE